jgi:hypothetical protein
VTGAGKDADAIVVLAHMDAEDALVRADARAVLSLAHYGSCRSDLYRTRGEPNPVSDAHDRAE